MPIAYIVKSTQKRKDKPCEMGLPFFENDIKRNLICRMGMC